MGDLEIRLSRAGSAEYTFRLGHMDFSTLSLDRLSPDARTVDYSHQISIHPYYCEFLEFFAGKKALEYNHLIVATHMVYGWMPTMLRLDTTEVDKILYLLNDIKKGATPTLSDLFLLRGMMNNSMVGPSKLLHFLDPKRFAIWDSRIYRYISGRVIQSQIAKAENYLGYLEHINELVSDPGFLPIHDHVADQMGTTYTKLRSAEIIMFETDKARRFR